VGLLDRLRWRTSLVPPDLRGPLDAEEVVVEHPNVSATLRFENYRAPGVYSSWRKTRVRGALVVTKVRLAFYTGHGPFVDVPYADPRFASLDLAATGRALTIGFDPHVFDEAKSGRVDVTVRMPEPDRALEWIEAEHRAAQA
jgi:hypothetical protein